MLEIGTTIGEWQVESQLAKGGMGEVYACRSNDGRQAAVKVLSSPDEASLSKRFMREFDALKGLHHPNIIKVYGFGHDVNRGLLWLAMELIEGIDFGSWFSEGALPAWEARDAILAVAEALSHAHGNQIFHRDIKPANLMRRSDGGVVLLDFGIALAHERTRLTQQGMIVGTLSYLPPEIFLEASIKSDLQDVYSLGVVLYEALVGGCPFPVPTDISMQKAMLHIYAFV